MPNKREHIIEVMSQLGERLERFGEDDVTLRVMECARVANGWFTPSDIKMAVRAICERMLQRDLLEKWLEPYPIVQTPKDIGVIMAGNIPLVGFFDMLCVLCAGHRCLVKLSSKDRVLMEYVTSLLTEIEPAIAITDLGDSMPDAIIATGSDNTNRYFRSRYGAIPSVLRGSRASAAILSGRETNQQIMLLARDIFSYSGLGCRNVSHLLVPDGYDVEKLCTLLCGHKDVNPKYINNFRQRRAMLRMQGKQNIEGRFFLLNQSDTLPSAISEITYGNYKTGSDINQWLTDSNSQLQCVVFNPRYTSVTHSRQCGFGESQSPALTDYPDDIDVMRFLTEL